ncbi:MAG: helix-turn-helix domain-containing protein [Chelatococcus sp.]|jgi:DNA-binding XRE family transcriptional regulator|uniref:hypothetical protein n=1 Tax=unclassified Chelatococcus TaxID=2638111 RepID=UPI001BCA8E91|nr:MULTISPECIES: hypothetical protein [unclassified Chelatococcus]CAH1654568.1 conserved hypothetical protein [Hyphomicrobiales bacterium]MBS7740268.1 helix-turn-helix domain-containing protein [Chelatococcus sp. HY11]MBX3540377.1 helix-turn-helix domain-containing protein [Chelatococcus sp.]MBX3544902.1 helix-turn-helix domain-containing protein [Chelatococcus sp.]MCO5078491.1 hypothetical protein [Chelatococcus sp.]
MTTTAQLAQWRNKAGASSSQMAAAMGVAIATYEDLEAGTLPIEPIHIVAAKWALLRICVEKHDGELAALDTELLQLVLAASRLIGRLGDTCG